MATRKGTDKPKRRAAAKGEDQYPRQKGGRFAPSTPDKPNPGKPIGAKHWSNRKLAVIAREYLDDGGDDAIRFLLEQRKNPAVLLATIEFLADRAEGKAPQTVKNGLDPDSLEAILLSMQGQALPGQRGGGSNENK
ncbi:MAG TPA: hypothetical protein VF761_17010 [Gemmatimonadaceae bacterium]